MNKKYGWLFSVGVCLTLLLGLVPAGLPVSADVGLPPMSPSGSGLGMEPGFETQVRMVAEEVNITIEPFERPVPEVSWGDAPEYHMRAMVEAVFEMRNLGTADESFDVWFPLATSVRYSRVLQEVFPEKLIGDFQVWVDGLPTATEQVAGPDLVDPTFESAYARFPVTFPAGQDVIIRVNYTLYPTGRRPFGSFEYILQTGAGWRDTIGEAVINIYYPDTFTRENLSMSDTSIEGYPLSPQPEGYTIENNVIHWKLTNLEPTGEDNIFVEVLEPARYRELVRARAVVQTNPNSVEAQLAYARAVENALLLIKSVMKSGGGLELAAEANAAHKKAIELAPERVDVYLAYVNWLQRSTGYRLWVGGDCGEFCDAVARGLELFPDNTELLNYQKNIDEIMAENTAQATYEAGYASETAQAAALTMTAAIPTVTPTPTKEPDTATPLPSFTLRPTTAPAEVVEKALDWGMLLLVILPVGLAAALAVYLLRKRKSD